MEDARMYNQNPPPQGQQPPAYPQQPQYPQYGGYPPQQPYYRKPSSGGGNFIVDFLLFRRMITTVIIQFIFWLEIILVVIGAITLIADGETFRGIVALIFGPLLVRVFCELLILAFRINETLTEIKNSLNR
jgi:hypothetical protein